MRHVNIKIHGKVQGVFFRQSAKEKAEQLNISGRVRNEEDGSVYIEAEGERENLESFLEWCRRGPSAASVSGADYDTSEELKGYQGFIIES